MSYRLFGRPFAGSLAVEWLLEELSVPYTRVLVTGYRDQVEPAWYAELNPLCQVPALELDDGRLLTESGAIMLYLADRHSSGDLAPTFDDPARLPYLRWLSFLSASVYPAFMQLVHPENAIDDPTQFDAVKKRASVVLATQWTMLEEALGADGHLAGGSLSAADFYLVMFVLWIDDDVEGFMIHHPAIARLASDLTQRPAVAAILERHEAGHWSD
ncbi:MAG: glutathione S-transferase family protein [Pseudomonadota bacterium]